MQNKTNLIIGTGNAWAWHKSPKLCPESLVNEKTFDSVEKVGALEPTGSSIKIFYNQIYGTTKNLFS